MIILKCKIRNCLLMHTSHRVQQAERDVSKERFEKLPTLMLKLTINGIWGLVLVSFQKLDNQTFQL